MLPHSSDDFHDYLDTMGREMEAASSFDPGPSFGVPEDDFDDYMNQLMTSSPSPPQRSVGLFRADATPGFQYTPSVSCLSTAYQGSSGSMLPTGFISHRMNGQRQTSSQPSGDTFHIETYRDGVSPSGDHLYMLESRNQIDDRSEHPRTIIHDRNRGAPHSRRPLDLNKGSRRLVSDLPDMYRGIFRFPAFNAMQSRCFDHIMTSNRDLVVSAPTGSGKTVLFELGIVALLSQVDLARSKVVYMAPTKALCSERFRDWSAKFDPLGIRVCELTGDTVQFGRSAWGDAKKSCIIITTAEKWDSLTRTWQDHESILSQIKLFLVDEVHVLNETRGSTLEVVISRMKTRNQLIRFLLVSATVPNIRDIADWMDSSREPNACEVLEFGEEYRPCKLTRFVIGVPRSNKQNEFQYATTLNNQLFPVLQQHSVMKPILIFCSTRKGTLTSAGTLLKSYEDAAKQKQRLPWVKTSRIDACFHDKRLQELTTHGIGVHHAGLGMEDRKLVEELFLAGTIRVLFATSTLSVGVNLPAHTVVIQGVKLFQNNAHVEYSDLEIMQMIGRAGRPQFDKDGIAIIMCEPQLVSKYQALTKGKTVLESSLHHNMLEHLNSEIALGTITNLQSAKSWLRNSFLYQRLQKNPSHYALHQDTSKTWHEKLEDIVLQNVGQLEATQLVRTTEDDQIQSTDFGDIMSKFCVRQITMANILKSSDKPTLREILEIIAAADEFSSLRMRASEKPVYNELRTHNDIRYTIKKVEKTSDKVFLLIQAILGNIPLNTPEMRRGETQPQVDAFFVFKHAARLAKVIVEVANVKQLGTQLLNGLEALRCLNAKAWEDRATVLRQIDQIGEKSLKVLAEHGITTLDLLRQQPAARIEILLNRKSPFGHEVLDSLAELPKYRINVSQTSVTSDKGKSPVRAKFSIECELVSSAPTRVKKKLRYHDITAILSLTSDYDLIDFRRISTKALRESKTFNIVAELNKPSQTIMVVIASESFAGTLVRSVVRPDVPLSEFPTPDTRPLSTLALDLKEFENDPDFWNMKFDETSGSDTTDVRNSASRCTGNIKGGEKSNQQDQPLTLRDGNNACHHSCADKLKCLHLCCKKGKQPPGRKKEKNNPLDVKERKEHRDCQATGDPTRYARSQAHNERQVKALERIHEKSDVQNSLKMKKDHRLKLGTTSSESRKRKIKPSFDINFTEVEAHSNASQVIETALDNDELPSIEQLLSGEPISGTKTEVQGFPQCHDSTPHKRPRLSLVTQESKTSDDTSEHFPHMLLDTSGRVGSHGAEVVKSIPQKGEFDELNEWLNSGLVDMD